ncbi:regulator of DNA class I crossover intermediates 1 [Apteryx mantelli]|uniref:Regulator of DNA class I crossover intermediates 1 n=1 Tax=Apteryx mantelli TaxID=2696672 RepID=A0ABM4ERQ3_9AVES
MQSRRFLECIDDNFLTEAIKKLRRRGALLDLILANKEELARVVKAGDSLGCSHHEIVEFRILQGGSREFFEKKKLKSKMKLLGVSPSPKSSAVSLDLLDLYIVNQISTKKDNAESVRKPVHIDMTGGIKIPVRRHKIELPMSPPRTQYTSNLDDIQKRPDYMNSASKNPVTMTSKEPESSERINEPFFGVVKETAELIHIKDERDCSFLAVFEDESQPVDNSLSKKHFNLFVNQSSTANFFIDLDDRNQMTNGSFTYDMRKVHPAVSAQRHSVDRHLKGIFTAPEQVLLKSNNASSTSYKENREPHKSFLQDNHKKEYCFVPSENKEKLEKLEENEAFTYHHDQQINLKENVQNHSRKKSDNLYVKESAWRQDQLLEFEELATAQEKECKFGVSPNLHELEKDMESSLGSQSPSYSPRQTDSCLSSSPDMHEEGDTANKKEYLNEQSFQIDDANLTSDSASTAPPKASQTGTVPLHPSRSLTMEESNHLQQRDSISPATEEENKDHTAPPESSSLHQALKREQVTHSTRCDVWSQTESTVTEVRKVDVATQSDTMQMCSCGSSCPCARSTEGLPPLGIAGTAGGHKMPAHAVLQPAGTGSAAGIAAFPSEAEYLSLADSTPEGF